MTSQVDADYVTQIEIYLHSDNISQERPMWVSWSHFNCQPIYMLLNILLH